LKHYTLVIAIVNNNIDINGNILIHYLVVTGCKRLNDIGLHTYMEGSVDIYKEAGGLDLYSLSIQPLHKLERSPPRAGERSDGAARVLIPIRSATLTDPRSGSRACPEQLSEAKEPNGHSFAAYQNPHINGL